MFQEKKLCPDVTNAHKKAILWQNATKSPQMDLFQKYISPTSLSYMDGGTGC